VRSVRGRSPRVRPLFGVFRALCAVCLPCAAGCAPPAVLSANALPVARVIVYRNGVAYFERTGHVDQDEVRFKMRPEEVDDFLATLAVMERGGSSVRAAAFPLEDDAPSQPARPRQDGGEGEPAPDKPDKPNGLRVVVLSLDGKAHDLRVGYVAECPVWRPSYRLVVRPNGEADLQAWGIVQNLSGEDWKDVSLSLVAGAPLAFRAELAAPVIPDRPVVTDQGEVIADVPHAETSLHQQAEEAPAPATPAPAPPPMAPAAMAAPARKAPSGAARAAGNGAPKKRVALGGFTSALGGPSGSATRDMDTESAATEGSPAMEPSAPRSLGSLAAVAALGGTTRYDLPTRVTVPDKSATMVLLLSNRVPGEALFLYAPDGGVPDSWSHPFRVARFANGTGGALERGPIAVFEDGSFLGQGMVDPLPVGATATVPFALERGIAVDRDSKNDEAGARLAKIENSELTIERDRVTQMTYRVRNGGASPAKLLIKHPRIAGSRLYAPPAGTEDNVGTGSALVPVTAGAHATVNAVVDERVTERRNADWLSSEADRAVSDFLADPKSDREIVQKLSVAWAFRTQIVKANQERNKLSDEMATLSRSTEETRENLRAIEKNKTAESLRQKLTARLADASARYDDENRRAVELDAKLAELRVQFAEAIRDLKWTAPAPPPSPAK
jgi:hypothetical protein